VAVSGADLVARAKAKLGDPYQYGATGPGAFDCSGLMQEVYGETGIKIPRTSEEQWRFGTSVSADQLQAGDLVFTAGSDGTASNPGHVGMYDGAGGVIQAPHTGTDVQVTPLKDFGATGYRRMPGVAGGVSAGQLGSVISSGGAAIGQAGGALNGTFGGSLFSWPDQIVGAFADADKIFADLYHEYALFTAPSTWIRVGAGLFGFVFLIGGLVLLAREVKNQ
jgi:hypothetical protein